MGMGQQGRMGGRCGHGSQGKMKGRRRTAERRRKRGEKKKRKMEKREGNKVVDTVDESMGMIDRASTMASSTRRATAKSCPTLIVKALGDSVLVYMYLGIFVPNNNNSTVINLLGGVARK